jgi:DNA-binding transcriptional regulator YdaS (Cro superfamily)
MNEETVTGVRRAINKAGGRLALAKLIGVSREAVRLWESSGHVPVKRCPAVAEKTGIPKHELNPIFN